MNTNPIEALWAVVKSQTGRVREWHGDDLLNHQPRYLADLRLIESLTPAGTVLEVGSAPCHMTALLSLAGFSVVGVDVDPGRIAELIQQLGLDVRRCDIEREQLPFADGSFGCVMLCETFEHLRIDPAFVLSEINRVLAPGATLVLTTPNVYSLPSLARFLLGRSIADPVTEFGKLRRLGHMGHVREYSAGEVRRFLEASGLAVESVDYRFHAPLVGPKKKLLSLAYHLVPRRFRRELVFVAHKVAEGPNLSALVPLLP